MKIKITSALDVRDGYGNIGQNLALALDTLGHDVSIEPVKIWFSTEELDEKVIRMINKPIDSYDYHLLIMYPDFQFKKQAKHWGIITMYEASKCPSVWTNLLNKLGATILAPSAFVQQMFLDSGVLAPVEHLSLATNSLYQPLQRPVLKDRNFRFLTVGKFEPRKNGPALINAFNVLSRQYQDVEIIFKTREHFVPKELVAAAQSNNRVKIISKTVAEPLLLDLYAYCDCFVYPSRGEGYSFPPRNALATGMPTIVTDWSALAEIDGAIKVPVKEFTPMYPCGFSYGEEKNLLMATIDYSELLECMEWVYLNYDLAVENIVVPTRTWYDVANDLVEMIERVIC